MCICLVFWSTDCCSPYRHLTHVHLCYKYYIVLTTHSCRPALVYLSSVLVHRLLLPLQASDTRTFYSEVFSNHKNFSFIFIMSVLRYRIVIFIDKTFRVSHLHIIRGFILQFFVSKNRQICWEIAILSYNNNNNNYITIIIIVIIIII